MSLISTSGKVWNSKWANGRARARNHTKFRRHLCRLANCPIDSCFTTGELLRSLRAERVKS